MGFESKIVIPAAVYDSVVKNEANIKKWANENRVTMFTNGNYAIESATVYVHDVTEQSINPAFQFELVSIPGSDFIKHGDTKCKSDEMYNFIAFGFCVYPTPDDHSFSIPAELLVSVRKVVVSHSPMLDVWIEPSFDDSLNTWLDGRPADAIQRYGLCLLNAFHFIQEKFLTEQRRILSFQKREVEHTKTSTGKYQPTTIKIGCMKYQYLYDQKSESARSYTRHIEAWSVRGHYRHYKSGKVVFVRPFKKGTGKVNPTVYEL